MYLDFDTNSPLVFTFSKDFNHLNKKFRENIYGGLVNVYCRDVTTTDDNKLPWSARYTPNNSKISCILALDFTSMYLHVQRAQIPTSPGIFWEKTKNGSFIKRNMAPGHSFQAQQWLAWMQETGFYFKSRRKYSL